MNKSSLDRGFGRCVVLRKYGTTMKKYKNRTTDRVVKPVLKPGEVTPISICLEWCACCIAKFVQPLVACQAQPFCRP